MAEVVWQRLQMNAAGGHLVDLNTWFREKRGWNAQPSDCEWICLQGDYLKGCVCTIFEKANNGSCKLFDRANIPREQCKMRAVEGRSLEPESRSFGHELTQVRKLHSLHQASTAQIRHLLISAYESRTDGAELVAPHGVSQQEWIAQGIAGSITWERALPLATFVSLCRPQSMLEVGSFIGLSSHFFSSVLAQWGGRLTSIDPNVRHRIFDEPRRIFHKLNSVAEKEGRIRTRDAFWRSAMSIETGTWDYLNREPKRNASWVKAKLASIPIASPDDFRRQFDMAFIDGAHDEASVSEDFEAMLPTLKPGACVVFDDVDAAAWPGTFAAVDKLRKQAEADASGVVLFGMGTACFIDQGYIAQRMHSKKSE